jgi:hypothetical protein
MGSNSPAGSGAGGGGSVAPTVSAGRGGIGGGAASGGSPVEAPVTDAGDVSTSGSGGADAGGTPDGETSDGVMPWDESIYGVIGEGAVYIFAEPYVTIVNGRVAMVQNAANPGTRDLVFSEEPSPGPSFGTTARPTWHANGGLNDRSYASFSGAGERGVATGFNFDPESGTHEVALQVVGRYREVNDVLGYGAVVTTPDLMSWMVTFQVRSDSTFDTWRTNGNIVMPRHNIDYLTPEASGDTAWHLHEGYAKATGLLAWYDGTEFGPAGEGGVIPGHGALTDVSIGGGYPNGSRGFAPCDIHEVVVTEGRDLAELAAYRSLRVAPIYGLDLQ